VVAFEAHPRLAEQGRAMFADAARDGRFTMVEGAVIRPEDWTAGKREVTFSINDVMTAVGSIDESLANRFAKRGDTTRRVSVAAVDFVDCLRTLGVPHSMKIDIEGFEPYAFQHAKNLFKILDFQIIFMEWGVLNRYRSELHSLIIQMMNFLN
jgi:FkbM family methyltransferase